MKNKKKLLEKGALYCFDACEDEEDKVILYLSSRDSALDLDLLEEYFEWPTSDHHSLASLENAICDEEGNPSKYNCMGLEIIMDRSAWVNRKIEDETDIQIALTPYLEIDQDNLEAIDRVPLVVSFTTKQWNRMFADHWGA